MLRPWHQSLINMKLSITDLAQDIGKKALFTVTLGKAGYKIRVPVVIKNVEILYGKPHYVVEPEGGQGQARVRDNLEILQ